ncbi:MAG TPA: helix-turn-helix domain-containing protein, partial [Planctomycetaceae bacterium]|nr:helix-turn-helix domain-containing protein [Planctomycetaceae bacterium]
MNRLVTPRQVGRALQVSESSVKRWCDKGVIPTQKTAGGHRRIPLSGLIEFLRESGQPILHPEVLGLAATSGRTNRIISRAGDQLTDAL